MITAILLHVFWGFFFAYDGTQDFQEKDINHIASQMENCSIHAIASQTLYSVQTHYTSSDLLHIFTN